MVPKRYEIYFIGQIILIKIVSAGLDPLATVRRWRQITSIPSLAQCEAATPDRCHADQLATMTNNGALNGVA